MISHIQNSMVIIPTWLLLRFYPNRSRFSCSAPYQQKKLKQAIQHFKKAIEINPHFSYAHRNLGFALLRLGKADHNFQGNVWNQVCDFSNRDFRPRKGSRLIDTGAIIPRITDGYLGKAPDIGAYEYGDKNYWIPGYQTKKASKPIPANGAKNAKIDSDLIWLGGYKATLHDVYFGTDFNAVAKANHDSKEYKGRQANNIFNPGELEKGKTYYWRVDAIGKTGKVVTGDVWQFIANPISQSQVEAKQKAKSETKHEHQAKELIVLANRAFRRGGYDNYKECVELCRKVLQDYLDTRYANHARRLLRRIPSRYRQDFKITKKEMGR